MLISCKDFYQIWKAETYIKEDNSFSRAWTQLVLTLRKNGDHLRQLVIEQDSRLDKFGKEVTFRFETWLDEEERQIHRNKILSEASVVRDADLWQRLLFSDAFSDVIIESALLNAQISWSFKVSLDQVDDENFQDYVPHNKLSDLVIDLSLYQSAEMRFIWDGTDEGEHKEKNIDSSKWLQT